MQLALRRAHLAAPVALVLALGCALPLLVLVVFSFFTVEDFDLVPAFDLASWHELFTHATYAILIGKAVLWGAGTAVLAAALGYPLALSLAALSTAWKGVGLVVLLTPLYTGEIVRIYAWRLVLGREGLVNSLLEGLGIIHEPLSFLLFTPFTTHLVLLYNNLPFMALALWVSIELVDQRLIEAARDLGARPLQAFARVTLPLTVPGLAAGGFAVFALAAGDMLTPQLLGGTSGSTAMTMIDSLFGTAFNWPMASALALGLLLTLTLTASLGASLLMRMKGARAAVASLGR